MTTVEDLLAPSEDKDAPLIKNGRYQIIPPGGEKAKPRTRITNFARELEDTFALDTWKSGMAAIGTAQNADIRANLLSLWGVGPWKELEKGAKSQIGDLCEQARDRAQANARRDIGSALHRFTERIDRGEDVPIPDEWAPDIEAYRKCLVDLGAEVVRIEEVVCVEDPELAGRFDRLVRIESMSRHELIVADLKTGDDLSYSWGSIAIQEALYAMAETIYDPASTTHSPMPKVNQDVGLVLHMPAGQGTCTPYWVDLEAGRRGIELVKALKSYRKDAKGFAHDEPPALSSVADPAVRLWVRSCCVAILDAGHGDELAARWPYGVPTLKATETHTEAELDLILEAARGVAADHRMPFFDDIDPRHIPTNKKR